MTFYKKIGWKTGLLISKKKNPWAFNLSVSVALKTLKRGMAMGSEVLKDLIF
jgi:hypothetical protein